MVFARDGIVTQLWLLVRGKIFPEEVGSRRYAEIYPFSFDIGSWPWLSRCRQEKSFGSCFPFLGGLPQVTLLVDDGAVVWLNGQELGRVALPCP